MASGPIADFQARAGLDTTGFSAGANDMAKSMYEAAWSVDRAWGIINDSAAKSAKASANVFMKAGMGPIQDQVPQFSAERIQQAAEANRTLTASMDKVTNSARASAAAFSETFAAEDRLNDLRVEQAAQTNKTLTASMDKVTNSARASAAAFSETFAAEDRLNDLRIQQAARSNAALTAQQDQVTKSAKESAHVFMSQLPAGYSNTFAKVQELNKGQEAGSKAASRFGLVMQQTGYQVQDFAVQVSGGQNALVAFSQQASQLLGFFGAAGAMAGAALAVGVLAARMIGLAVDTDSAAEATERLGDAYKKLNEASKDFDNLSPTDKLSAASSSVREAEAEVDRTQNIVDQWTRKFRQEGARMEEGWGLMSWLVPDDLDEIKSKLNEARDAAVAAEAELLEARKAQMKAADELNKEEADERVKRAQKEADARIQEEKRVRAEIERAGEKKQEAFEKEADRIKDILDPMRKRIRAEQELNDIVEAGLLTQVEADRYRAMLDRAKVATETPVNAYQRRGLSLDAMPGRATAGSRSEELLSSIDRNITEIRRKQVQWN